MRSSSATSCLIALPLLLAGCDVYDPALVNGSGGPNRPGCSDGSEEAPTRPDIADEGPDASVDEVVFALKDVIIDTDDLGPDGVRQLWETVGLNIDERCTSTENQLLACNPPVVSTSFARDGTRGIDNVFGASLFGLVDNAYQTRLLTEPEPHYAPDLQTYCTRVQEEGGVAPASPDQSLSNVSPANHS